MRAKLVVVTVAAVAVTAATAVNVTGKPTSKPRLSFTVNGKIETAHLVDDPPAGGSVGDVITFTQKLRDGRGRVVGSAHAVCTQSLPAGHHVCSGGFLLRGGEITIQGVDPPESVTRHPLVVTGGAGGYRGVRGEITVHHLSPIEDRFDFHLSS